MKNRLKQTISFVFFFSSLLISQTHNSISVFDLATASQTQKASLSQSPSVLLILGDSLTEGYGVAQEKAFPALLQKKLELKKINHWKIVPAGSSGSTTASGPSRLKWLLKNKPQKILYLLGSNDGLRGLKISETEKNIQAVIDMAKENKIEIAIGELHVPPNYGAQYSKDFNLLYKKMAQKNKILLAPFLLDKVAGQASLNIADGIHPNEKGHEQVAINLEKFIFNWISVKK